MFWSCSIAVKTKEELLNQRLAMKAIQTKMTTLVSILFISVKINFLYYKIVHHDPKIAI